MTDLDAINKVRDDMVEGFNAGDLDSVIACLADDSIGMPPDAPAKVGKEVYGAYIRNLMESYEVRESITVLETEIAGEWAYDRGTWVATIVSKADGTTSEVGGDYLWILRKSADGAWRPTRLIWNNDQPATG
jgi:ketosteroid isomerase-like protein